MKNRIIVLFVALLLVGAVVVTSAFAFLFGNNNGNMGNDDVRDAMESGDYDAYVAAFEERVANRLMTEDQFNEMAERHAEMEEYHEAIESAIESGDYDAWYKAMEDMQNVHLMTNIINEDNFDTFVAMHDVMEDGDFETAATLREELGLRNGPRGGFGPGKGQAKGFGGHRMGGQGGYAGNCSTQE